MMTAVETVKRKMIETIRNFSDICILLIFIFEIIRMIIIIMMMMMIKTIVLEFLRKIENYFWRGMSRAEK